MKSLRNTAYQRVVLSLPEYVLAFQRRTLGLYRGVARTCSSCHAIDALGLVIRYRRQPHCAHCVPATKICARCSRPFRLTRFRVQKGQSGLRLDSYCPRCARARQRVRYQDLKATRPVARGRVCTECGHWKRTRDFYRHSTSAGGLNPTCKRCKDARAATYLATAIGRLAGASADGNYRHRLRGRARAGLR